MTKVKPQGLMESDKTRNTKQARVQKLGRVVLPVTTVIFIFFYIIYAVYSYFNPHLQA